MGGGMDGWNNIYGWLTLLMGAVLVLIVVHNVDDFAVHTETLWSHK